MIIFIRLFYSFFFPLLIVFWISAVVQLVAISGRVAEIRMTEYNHLIPQSIHQNTIFLPSPRTAVRFHLIHVNNAVSAVCKLPRIGSHP